MKKLMIALVVAASMMTAFAQESGEATAAKKKLPTSVLGKLDAAVKAAEKYEAPIFVVAVAKGTPAEAAVKKIMAHKFFKELASKGFVVYTMKVDLSKKEKEADGKTPKALYEKLSKDDQDLLNVICPPDKVRKLPAFGMVTSDAKQEKIKAVDMPLPPAPDATYYGEYLQKLQSAAQAYGIDIEMSKEMRKYIENPPAEKNKAKKSKKRK